MTDEKRVGGWIQTYTGIKFYPCDPRSDEVVLADIAHALANICRFNGHTTSWYPVAAHSVHVSKLVPLDQAMEALMHDASEAYICDLPAPVKESPLFAGYLQVEALIQNAVQAKFGLGFMNTPEIKQADRVALATEVRDLIAEPQTGVWNSVQPDLHYKCPRMSPREAEMLFLNRYEELTVLASQISMF